MKIKYTDLFCGIGGFRFAAESIFRKHNIKIDVNDSQIRKQAGNAVPVNLVQAVLESFLPTLTREFTEQPKQNRIRVKHDGEALPSPAYC